MGSSNPTTTTLNGVNVGQLEETIGAIRNEPDLARFRFRAHNTWRNGGHSRLPRHPQDRVEPARSCGLDASITSSVTGGQRTVTGIPSDAAGGPPESLSANVTIS